MSYVKPSLSICALQTETACCRRYMAYAGAGGSGVWFQDNQDGSYTAGYNVGDGGAQATCY